MASSLIRSRLLLLLSFWLPFAPPIANPETQLHDLCAQHCADTTVARATCCCDKFLAQIQIERPPVSLIDFVRTVFGERRVYRGRTRIGEPIIVKYLHARDVAESIGFTVCPAAGGMQRLVAAIRDNFPQHGVSGGDEQTAIQQVLLQNPHGLLVGLFKRLPVPQHHATCGPLHVESDAGPSLVEFYVRPFAERLRIGKNLLQAAVELTHGDHGFSVYMTDMRADNVAVDSHSLRVRFVDLDSVIVVDATSPEFGRVSPHRHTPIPCDDCFAFVPDDICGAPLSDLNLYAGCRLLLEDPSGRREGSGFLHSMPTVVHKLLEACVNGEAEDRFELVQQLIALFESILYNEPN